MLKMTKYDVQHSARKGCLMSIIRTFLGVGVIAISLLMAATASAQMVCGERSVMVDGLLKNYAEAPVSIGLASNGSVIEVFASPDRSWTIVMTRPNGLSCVVAAGEDWETLVPIEDSGVDS